MSSTLEYPGTAKFRAQMELPLPLDGADLDFSEIQERLVACCDVVLIGLSLDDRISALKRWVDIYEKMLNLDEKRVKLGFVHVDTLLLKFKEAGFFDVLRLVDADTVNRVCSALDDLASVIIELQPDSPKIKPFVEEFIDQLPLIPEYTIAGTLFSDKAGFNSVQTYELANRLYNESIDNKLVAYGCSLMNDEDTRQEWLLHNMKENERAKFRALQSLDKEMDKEFGALKVKGPRSGALAAVGSLITSSKAKDEMIIAWQGRIRSAKGVFSGGGYLGAYSTFLEGRVRAAAGEISGAVKRFKEALKDGFDPQRTVSHLVFSLSWRKKNDEARSIIEEWVPRLWLSKPSEIEGIKKSNLGEIYIDAGGDINNLQGGETSSEFIEKAKQNIATRRGAAEAWAAKHNERRKELLDDYAREGLTLLDGMLSPVHYDAAITGDKSQEIIAVEPSGPALLCLDQTELFVEVGTDQLVKMTTGGLPANEAASYLLQIFERAKKQYSLGWKDANTICPVLSKSEQFSYKMINSTIEQNDFTNAREMLEYFYENSILSSVNFAELITNFATKSESASQGDVIVDFVESFSEKLKAEDRPISVSLAVNRLMSNYENAKSLGDKISILERIEKLDSTNDFVQQNLSSLKKSRSKRNLIITASIIGSLALAAGIYFILKTL